MIIMDKSLFEWSQPNSPRGVIVGCDQQLEWMLPWWWMHFHMHNQLPVTFFDFGNLSSQAKNWCLKRGEVKALPSVASHIEEIAPGIVTSPTVEWDKLLAEQRNAWFQKPFACLNSPYESSIWIDLDCQVRNSLEPLFPFCENPVKISMVQETQLKALNTGVIVFKKGCPLIRSWAEICLASNRFLRGDQDAMSELLKKQAVPAFPQKYHLLIRLHEESGTISLEGETSASDATILHWVGYRGKHFIQKEMDFLEKKLFMNFSFEG